MDLSGPRRDISWRWCLNGGTSSTGNAGTTSVGTVMLRRARPQPKQQVPATSSAPRVVNAKKVPRKDGWLWGFKAGKMSAEELRKWTMEGDRIQWFRAEAEMERWREQVEIVMADWRTSIRSFMRSGEVWMQLAATQDAADIGHIAYAKWQAHICAQREKQGRTLIGDHPTLGPKYGCIADDNLDLVAFVTKNREEDQRLQDALLEHCRVLEVDEAAERQSREEGGEEEDEDEWETDNEGNEEDEEEDEDEGEDEDEDDEEPGLTQEAPASWMVIVPTPPDLDNYPTNNATSSMKALRLRLRTFQLFIRTIARAPTLFCFFL
ncbi:hypothetical protein B0H13DRAFT_1908459 [Mycena leptocephala]|nr:hypothetical protein B0H13DRAFT_1908459 [Mycena leptocephala]